MDFIDQLKQFSKRVESMKDSIQTEEATKTAIIMPFFSMLGYDVFNPQEFVPEFTADVGIKKGEKVDYAIIRDGQPVILIECKSISENLDRHDSQLFAILVPPQQSLQFSPTVLSIASIRIWTAQTKWMMIPS